MKIERYVKLIIKKWWIIALLEVIALGATYYYVTRQSLTYTSTATLILNPKSTNSIIPFTNTDTSSVTSLAENYNLVLKSETFLNQVTAKLGFDISSDDLKKAFTSKLTPNTLFYYISATSTTPEKAQKIASTVTQIFLQNQTDKSKDTAQASSATALKNQQDAYDSLTAEIADIDNQLKDLQTQTSAPDTQTKIATLNEKRRTLVASQSQAVLAIAQLKNTVTTSSDSDYALLYTEARLPTQADASNLSRNLIFAFALALALGIGVILLLDYLDGSVRSKEDLVGLTGKSPLAEIPEIGSAKPTNTKLNLSKNKTKNKDEVTPEVEPSQKLAIHKGETKLDDLLVTSSLGYSPAAEAYRSLRTNMLFSSPLDKLDKPINPTARSFLVTSALPGEGRSLTAANLAIAFAQTGKKVILIDSDLRHPSLHNLFNLNNETGFSDLALSGITKLTKAVHSTSIQNLVVVTSGSTLSNPSELLTSTKATNVIKFFKNIADIVIFDSPPVSLVTDAAILANMVDQVVLVVEHHVTPRSMVASTMLELNKVGAQLDGVILNRVKDKRSRRFRNYFNYQPVRAKTEVMSKTDTQEKSDTSD